MKKLFFLTLVSGLMLSAGIRIAPATFVVEAIEPGESVELYETYGHIIKIWGGNSLVNYSFEPVKPSESGTKITGYYDFPNPSWFSTEHETLVVLPNLEDPFENKMYLTVPEGDNWYNRHWLLGVNVSPVLRDDMGSIVLGAYLQLRFESSPKADVVPELEYREIVFVPSVLEFNDVEPGKEYLGKVTIFTGNRIPAKYQLYPLDPESPVGKVTILNAPGYRRLPQSDWLYYEPEVHIAQRGLYDLYFSLFIPEKPERKRYEELIMIEGHTKGFLRVRIVLAD